RAQGVSGPDGDRRGDRAAEAADDGRHHRRAHGRAGEVPRVVGRGNLSRLAALAVLVLALPAPAGAAVPWRLLADGPSVGGGGTSTKAYVAVSRDGAAAFGAHLSAADRSKLASLDFTRAAVIAVFGEF